MPIDQPDPADAPDAPRPPDEPQPERGRRPLEAARSDPTEREAEYHAYRTKVDQAYAADRVWAEAVPSLRADWQQHKEQYSERARAVPQTHPDNSWSSGDVRRLTPDQNAAVDQGYGRICEIGERDIVPLVLAVQSEDSGRRLAGFDRHIKGADRLKEKIADRMRAKGWTPDEALANIPDTVRFTFEYSESSYTAGVRDDVKRLGDRGFIQVELRNTWEDSQYKGINSRWREPGSGVVFEVQFHTHASLEAKELTHQAYERIRSTARDDERVELKDFQHRVNSLIPIPPGAEGIEDYPPGGR